MENLFSVSNQKWKMVTMAIVTLCQLLLLIISLNNELCYSILNISNSTLSIAAILFGIFIFLPTNAFLLRCPKCKVAMIWYIMRKKEQREFGRLFFKTISERCPACEVNYSDILKEKQKNER